MVAPGEKGSALAATTPEINEMNHPILAVPGEGDKRLATAQARAALCGCRLTRLDSGGFLLGRWNLTRKLADLDEVEALITAMGVRQ